MLLILRTRFSFRLFQKRLGIFGAAYKFSTIMQDTVNDQK